MRYAGATVRTRLLLIALCAPLAMCTSHRTVVTRPGLTVAVVDAAGAPIPGAAVVLHWWSYPYGRLQQSFPYTADAAGRVAMPPASRDEEIAPLCMHGVPEHHHTLCVGAPGHGWTELVLERDAPPARTVALPGGAYAGECATWSRVRPLPLPPGDAGR